MLSLNDNQYAKMSRLEGGLSVGLQCTVRYESVKPMQKKLIHPIAATRAVVAFVHLQDTCLIVVRTTRISTHLAFFRATVCHPQSCACLRTACHAEVIK